VPENWKVADVEHGVTDWNEVGRFDLREVVPGGGRSMGGGIERCSCTLKPGDSCREVTTCRDSNCQVG
jgi:hypothetical protein